MKYLTRRYWGTAIAMTLFLSSACLAELPECDKPALPNFGYGNVVPKVRYETKEVGLAKYYEELLLINGTDFRVSESKNGLVLILSVKALTAKVGFEAPRVEKTRVETWNFGPVGSFLQKALVLPLAAVITPINVLTGAPPAIAVEWKFAKGCINRVVAGINVVKQRRKQTGDNNWENPGKISPRIRISGIGKEPLEVYPVFKQTKNEYEFVGKYRLPLSEMQKENIASKALTLPSGAEIIEFECIGSECWRSDVHINLADFPPPPIEMQLPAYQEQVMGKNYMLKADFRSAKLRLEEKLLAAEREKERKKAEAERKRLVLEEQRRQEAAKERERLAKETKERERLAKEARKKKEVEDAARIAIEKERRLAESKKLHPASSGSGFLVSREGHIVTNNHVIQGCQDIKARQATGIYKASMIGSDPVNDIAVLKADLKSDSYLKISESPAYLTQDVYVAGFPFGTSLSSRVKTTKGIISSLSGISDNYAQVQIDAALQQGNSGGPIINEAGNVVGVAVAKLDLKFAIKNLGTIPENINFGVKASTLENLLIGTGVPYEKKGDKAFLPGRTRGKMLEDSTVFLSCWMTMAQVKKMRTQKVVFEDLR